MARFARVIVPGIPHHIIQRGNRRQEVFFSREDHQAYLQFLKVNSRQNNVKIVAYCLMRNHIHLVVIPQEKDGLSKAIGDTHREYSRRINFRMGWRGYLFQGRFLSYPMEESHLYEAVRYVENNPVKAGAVQRAEDYEWSSARSHSRSEEDDLMGAMTDYVRELFQIVDWESYLRERIGVEEERQILYHIKTGWPRGNYESISRWERLTERRLIKKKPGPKNN